MMTSDENFSRLNQNIINQIYWNNVTDSYMKGANFYKYNKNFVRYQNPLMASGKKIKVWHSTVDYSSYKEVPELPMLVNDRQYRIVIRAVPYPSNSVIYRLTFFNLQGNVINQFSFVDSVYEFVFPTTATSYSLEMINGGCKDLFFERIQISEASIPDKYFDNLYFEQLNSENDKIGNLILIADGKRTRRLIPNGISLIYNPFLYVVNISWQFHGSLTNKLCKWIERHLVRGFRIFSTDSKFDAEAIAVQNTYPQVDVITSTDLATLNHDEDMQVHKWYRKDVYDPNWALILKELNNYFRK